MARGSLPITVVYDGPDRSAIRLLGRHVSATVGGLFLVVGALAVLPAFVLTIAVGLTWYASRDAGHDVTDDWPVWVRDMFVPSWIAAIAATWLGLVVGLRLLRGERRVVLFLRRFGYDQATEAATVAATSVGGFWRLVTLDDAEIAPIGAGEETTDLLRTVDRMKAIGGSTGRVVTSIWKVVVRVSAVVAVAAVGVTAYQADGDVTAKLEKVIGLLALAAPDDDAATTIFRLAAATLAVSLGAALAWFGLVVATSVFTLPAGSFLGSVRNSVRAADSSKRIPIANSTDIVLARSVVQQQSRKVFGARLMVLRVNSAVWQETVAGLADASALPLIDISEPTDNVMWEIETLLDRFGPRCVFIGTDERLRALNVPALPGSLHQRLQALLVGHEVLAYTATKDGMKRFVRSLRATFEHHTRLPSPKPHDREGDVRQHPRKGTPLPPPQPGLGTAKAGLRSRFHPPVR